MRTIEPILPPNAGLLSELLPHVGHVTRDEAERLGLDCYYDAERCRNGHLAARRTADDVCVACGDPPPMISRAEAQARGLNRYYSGRPCRRNHLAERRTATGACVACLRITTARYRRTEKGKAAGKAAMRRYWNRKRVSGALL